MYACTVCIRRDSLYWDRDLIGGLLWSKMLIFEVWISMKSSFDQVSTTSPGTVSFSSIFSCLILMRDHFMFSWFQIYLFTIILFKGDFYSSKGWLMWNHHIFIHCFCSILSLRVHEKISQVTKKTSLHIIYLRSVQGFC